MPLLIHTNCPDPETARTIAEALIAERLVACANFGAGIDSLYYWQGEVARETEVPLLVKTRPELWDRVAARIRELHPYNLPAILGTLPDRIDPGYAQWIRDETVDS